MKIFFCWKLLRNLFISKENARNVVPDASIQTKMGSYSVDLEAIKVDYDINGDLVIKESCIKNQKINLQE